MNKINIITYLLISTFFLTACSTTNNVAIFTPQITKDKQAAVYIYRPFATTNALYSPDLYINDDFKLSIKNGKSTRFTQPPGHYTFELEPDKNYSGETSLSLNLSAGNTYFIRVNTSLKIKSALTYQPYQRSFNLTTVDQQLAKKEIAACCLATNSKSNTDQQTKTVKTQTEEGFSVDKTQNPFSY